MRPEKTAHQLLSLPHLSLGLILAALLGTGALFAYWGKVEFDEAFNLQIPVSLALHGDYRTTWQHGEPFDPHITTGQTVLVPIAAMFALFGIGIFQARLVMLVYFALFSVLVLYISRRLSGNLASVLSLLFLFSLPSVFEFGVKVYGEVPGTVFLLLGMIAFSRNRFFASGLLLGLAILAKHVFALSLLPTGILLLSWLYHTPVKRKILLKISSLAAGLAVPLITWEAVRFSSLGWNTYQENWEAYLQLMQETSDELVISGNFWLERIRTLGNPFGNALFWFGIVLWLGILAYSLYHFRAAIQDSRHSGNEILGLQLALFGCVHLIWWFFRTESAWWRYLLPGYLVLAILAGVTIGEWVKSAFEQWRHPSQVARVLEKTGNSIVAPDRETRGIHTGLTALAITLTVLVPLQLQAVRLLQEIRQTNHYQQRLAGQIRDLSDQGAKFGYWGWFQAPELSFLAQVHFFDIYQLDTRDRLKKLANQGIPVYIIVSEVQKGMDPESLEEERRFLGKVFLQSGDYRVHHFRTK